MLEHGSARSPLYPCRCRRDHVACRRAWAALSSKL